MDRTPAGEHDSGEGQTSHDAAWRVIVEHYEACLREFGATPRGVDWPNPADLATRFRVMLEAVDGISGRPAVLDLGCGAGLLLDYLSAVGRLDSVDYRGIDLSQQMVDVARSRWPAYDFSSRDIIAAPLPAQSVDVVLMNGILTERLSLGFDAMVELAQSLIA